MNKFFLIAVFSVAALVLAFSNVAIAQEADAGGYSCSSSPNGS
jgi:hypothetical protein